MKKLLFLLIASGMTYVHADELKKFNDIATSVQNGENIKLYINFDNCLPKPPFPNLSVSISATAVMIAKDHLQFANSALTTNNPDFQGKPVVENVTYRLTNDEQLHITTRVISLPKYIVTKETIMVCSLATAVRVFN